MRSAVARLDRKVQSMIEQRRASADPADDFLTRLLRARDEDGSHMADQQVRDEIVTLFAAGYETTATALAWAFHDLSLTPEAGARLTEEADAIRSDDDYGDPARVPYALKVFKETLRLHPPAYVLARRAREAVKVGDYDLEKGSIVFTPIYAMHRRPDLFPDPERFDPERFAPAAEAKRRRGSYLPFGAGPRFCIGNHFSLMEGPIVLLALSRKFSFEITSAVETAPSATLRPKQIMARVKARSTSRPDVARVIEDR
jgi:cytochrome P450